MGYPSIQHYFFLMLVVSLFGCKRLALLSVGFKQPQLENYISLTHFLVNKQIDTSEMLCFRDTTALNRFYKRHIGIPESRFFNRRQELVDYKSSPKDCNGQVAVFLEKLDTVNQKPPVPGEMLEAYLQDVVHVESLTPFALDTPVYDAYLVIYWAKYLGRANKYKVFEWLELVKDAKKRGLKVRVIKIDTDYQQAWRISQDDLPHFDF